MGQHEKSSRPTGPTSKWTSVFPRRESRMEGDGMADGDRRDGGTPGGEVVYGLRMRGEDRFFHIGSGSERRARDLTRRSPAVRSYIEARGGDGQVEVVILERHRCPARARLREMERVGLHQPETNTFGRSSIPHGSLDGRPKGSKVRCSCGAPDCYGAEVSARSR
jgi:hypothetical protein